MKKKWKNIFGSLITIILTILLLKYIGYRLNPAWSDDGIQVIKAFHKLEKDSCDVIVYGSSHAWKGFDTRELEKEYSLSAYNYACNWQAINTTLLFLQDSLQTQSPSVVCIDTYCCNDVLHDTKLTGQIYYCRAIPSSKYKMDFLKQCFRDDVENWASYYLPIMMFHENWKAVTVENYLVRSQEELIQNRGYYSSKEVFSCEPVDEQCEQYQLSIEARQVLDSIVECCEKKGIKVLFYTCPYYGENNYSDALSEYCKDNGCEYLNLFEKVEEMGFNWETDLQDEGHLNDSGAKKVADYLGGIIIKNYITEVNK